MKNLRLPLLLALACLLSPFAGLMIYKAYKTREIRMYDAVLSKPVVMAPSPKNAFGKPFTNSLGMRFVYIPPGRFVMGSPPDEIGRDELEIQHPVILSKGFYLQTTEVTQAQWRAVMEINPSQHQGDDLPVDNVSWRDCKKFIIRLNRLEGDTQYKLPSEAEWEYTCRAGSQKAFTNGSLTEPGSALDPLLDQVGWYKANSGRAPHPVASKSPNAWGLYDMHGNVWEWAEDWWENWYSKFSGIPVTDPLGPVLGRFKIIRGGGWFAGASYQRCASRKRAEPGSKGPGIGFRVARSE
jgi:formylglycine-generating enzyme required for sulfatase activity